MRSVWRPRDLPEQARAPMSALLFSVGKCDHNLKLSAEGRPTMPRIQTTEDRRLEEARIRKKHWKRWGPYLSERQWGTVREDYSPGGTAWEFFPHDHARSRAYRWGEDGIGGICDRHQILCFALALWNGRDPILKERIFGLTGNQGNHGDDVKEYYFYLDSTRKLLPACAARGWANAGCCPFANHDQLRRILKYMLDERE